MSREELALETQLLLQEVSQVTQYHQAEAIVEEATTTSAPASEYEEAKSALLEKLKRKKELKRQQLQQTNQRRFGIGALPSAVQTDANSTASEQPKPPQTTPRKVSPVKARSMMKLPVAASAGAASRKQKDMLSKLRTQAIQQGSQEMAKLFGYASYEEQLKHLNKIEKQKIIQHELLEQAHAAKDGVDAQEDVEMLNEEGGDQDDGEEADGKADGDNADDDAMNAAEEEKKATSAPVDDANALETTPATPVDASVDASTVASEPSETTANAPAAAAPAPVSPTSTVTASTSGRAAKLVTAPPKRRMNHIKDDEDEDDGNDADSEQDGNGDDAHDKEDDVDDLGTSAAPPRDRAAGYRRLLQAEALRTKQRKRLKQTGDFVEAEAEEDEEEDALKIGGLGDFGFGVPQAKTQESKEAEEERKALQLRDDDLDGIVDDLSDDERAQAQDLDEMFRKELEQQDRQQVKEVMRNVKEGFGRNRRAFSAGLHGAEARGRFNLDELVAADGKLEAARLGLLESDEELSDGEANAGGKKKKKSGDDDEEGEEDEEEDEEAEMERMLRERFLNQPKIYITSSESENDDDDTGDAKGATDDNDAESDEERERQQMKLFSERARINRRMQRMKEMQRHVALERDDGDAKTDAAVPNLLLLDDDDDSHELLQMLHRTDKTAALAKSSATDKRSVAGPAAGARKPAMRSRMGFGVAASARSSSSFSRVANNVKMFNSSSGASAASAKGFVFTSSFSADRVETGDENAAPLDNDAPAAASTALTKSKSWSAGTSKRGAAALGSSRPAAPAKKQRKSGFLSVLSSFQRVTQTTASASSSQQ